ncbi:MAG: copper resistance protein CopC [Vicinamibacterales bacterium]
MTSVRTALAAVTAAAVLFVGSTSLSAHMKIEKSTPAANAVVTSPQTQVQVFFSEAPDLKVSKMEIKGPSAKTKLSALHVMDKSLMAMVEGEMPDGVYTVSWTTAGDDGHVQKGDFTFTVKRK